MTNKKEPIEVQFFCMPEGRDLDAALHDDEPEGGNTYCWSVHQGSVSAEFFEESSIASCPKCGANVDIKPITALGTFIDADRHGS